MWLGMTKRDLDSKELDKCLEPSQSELDQTAKQLLQKPKNLLRLPTTQQEEENRRLRVLIEQGSPNELKALALLGAREVLRIRRRIAIRERTTHNLARPWCPEEPLWIGEQVKELRFAISKLKPSYERATLKTRLKKLIWRKRKILLLVKRRDLSSSAKQTLAQLSDPEQTLERDIARAADLRAKPSPSVIIGNRAICSYLGVSLRRLEEWRKNENLPVIHLSNEPILHREAALLWWLDKAKKERELRQIRRALRDKAKNEREAKLYEKLKQRRIEIERANQADPFASKLLGLEEEG